MQINDISASVRTCSAIHPIPTNYQTIELPLRSNSVTQGGSISSCFIAQYRFSYILRLCQNYKFRHRPFDVFSASTLDNQEKDISESNGDKIQTLSFIKVHQTKHFRSSLYAFNSGNQTEDSLQIRRLHFLIPHSRATLGNSLFGNSLSGNWLSIFAAVWQHLFIYGFVNSLSFYFIS